MGLLFSGSEKSVQMVCISECKNRGGPKKTLIISGEIIPVKPFYFRPFIQVRYNSIYNDRLRAYLVSQSINWQPLNPQTNPWRRAPSSAWRRTLLAATTSEDLEKTLWNRESTGQTRGMRVNFVGGLGCPTSGRRQEKHQKAELLEGLSHNVVCCWGGFADLTKSGGATGHFFWWCYN